MTKASNVPASPAPATADQRRNEVLRTEGRSPETPVAGYRFDESPCLTPGCGARVKYEVSSTAPWRLNIDHVVCELCAATYKVTLENPDTETAQVTFRTAHDRQS
jgi:hypothetical protein